VITAGPEVTAKRHASPDVEVAARVSGAIDVGEGARNVIDCGVEPAGAATLSFDFPALGSVNRKRLRRFPPRLSEPGFWRSSRRYYAG
jgi:hypothetical protein